MGLWEELVAAGAEDGLSTLDGYSSPEPSTSVPWQPHIVTNYTVQPPRYKGKGEIGTRTSYYGGDDVGYAININLNASKVRRKVADAVSDKASIIKKVDTARHEAMNAVLYRHMYEYIPYRTGNLANNVVIDNEGIYFGATSKKGFVYAGVQYTGPDTWERDLLHHPKATSFWDKKAWPDIESGVVADCGDILKKAVRGALK